MTAGGPADQWDAAGTSFHYVVVQAPSPGAVEIKVKRTGGGRDPGHGNSIAQEDGPASTSNQVVGGRNENFGSGPRSAKRPAIRCI